ncbi:Asd/ArgC dimerization domain-containing protein [Bacillus paranthracis]
MFSITDGNSSSANTKSIRLERIIVSTYQAVSGSGIHTIQELKEQAKSILAGEEVESTILPAKKDKKHYPIAFNVLPSSRYIHG